MNKIELFIYNIVKDNPDLKQKVVDIYQGLLGLIPQKAIDISLPYTERVGFFHGFHDKSPFSTNGKLLLAHKIKEEYKVIKPGAKIEVGFFSGDNWQSYTPLNNTLGWNWQLGSMLQWFGNSNELVAYNILTNDKQGSIVQNINGHIEKEYDLPIVHISPDQKYASSYNYFRSEKAMPGYGMISESPSLKDNETDAFKVFSCESGDVAFEITLKEIMNISPHPSMDGAFHFFHHSLFNPISTRLFFLHRWVDKSSRRWTRMFSVNIDGSELYLFPMDEMVSHITWASENEIFAYLRYPNQGEGYFLVEDKTGKSKRYFEDVLNSDGHPTMDKKRGYVLTDTYPDRFRNQFLVLGMTESGKRIDLCKTHLPSLFKRHLQVDLHPRLHPFASVACVDSAHTGQHSLLTINFGSVLK